MNPTGSSAASLAKFVFYILNQPPPSHLPTKSLILSGSALITPPDEGGGGGGSGGGGGGYSDLPIPCSCVRIVCLAT